MKCPDQESLAKAFDTEFLNRTRNTDIRPEQPEDATFLKELFVACSPLRTAVPDALLLHQAELAQVAFSTNFTQAMRRTILVFSQPAGRIIVDWTDCIFHGVDIAVHPDFRSSGIGLALLRAWTAVADANRRACSLEVLSNNPAKRIYEHLGFKVDGSEDEGLASIRMVRPVTPQAALA